MPEVVDGPTIVASDNREPVAAMLEGEQPLNETTHAVHAAAWADLEGRIRHVSVNVGRHNALDKLIGALLSENAGPGQGLFIVTSRCSFEWVEKVAAFGARTLIAISPPTSPALERARRPDIALMGIARCDSTTVFHDLERIRMKIEKLIRMANQIEDFFRSYPDNQAVAGIHDHLVAFWTPRMRSEILAHADRGGEGLEPLVVEALRTFKTGKSPIEKEVSGPEKVGQLGSDAG